MHTGPCKAVNQPLQGCFELFELIVWKKISQCENDGKYIVLPLDILPLFLCDLQFFMQNGVRNLAVCSESIQALAMRTDISAFCQCCNV